MKFKHDDSDKMAHTWYNARYAVTLQKTAGARSDTYIVFLAVDDAKTGEYTPMYPRFEAHGLENAGPIAETIVREMARLRKDAPLPKAQKVIDAVSELLRRAYRKARIEQSDRAFKEINIGTGNTVVDFEDNIPRPWKDGGQLIKLPNADKN